MRRWGKYKKECYVTGLLVGAGLILKTFKSYFRNRQGGERFISHRVTFKFRQQQSKVIALRVRNTYILKELVSALMSDDLVNITPLFDIVY